MLLLSGVFKGSDSSDVSETSGLETPAEITPGTEDAEADTLQDAESIADAEEDSPASLSQGYYEVQAGDTLTGISVKELGDGARWEALMTLNPSILTNKDVIFPGQRIKMPQ